MTEGAPLVELELARDGEPRGSVTLLRASRWGTPRGSPNPSGFTMGNPGVPEPLRASRWGTPRRSSNPSGRVTIAASRERRGQA